MLTSIMVTYEEKEEFFIRSVLKEIKRTEVFKVRKVLLGQLFAKRAASIILPENQLQNIFDKLTANEMEIYPFNHDYKTRIAKTKERVSELNLYQDDRKRAELFRFRRKRGLNYFQNENEIRKQDLPKVPKALPKEVNESLAKVDLTNSNNLSIDVNVKEGNYVAIRNMIKNNPLQNEKLKEKYIPAIKNSILINLENGLNKDVLLNVSIAKLKEIICDEEIKAIRTDDIIVKAGEALIKLCSEKNREELVNLINLPSIGQRLNVMAAVKLAELIFEAEGSIDEKLLKYSTEKINRRFLLTSYDVIEPSISDLNKSRFDLLFNSIQEMAA